MPPKKKKELVFEEESEDEIILTDEEKEDFEKPQKSIKIRTEEVDISKLELHDQILLRPDTYIGFTNRVKCKEPVWVVKNNRFVQDTPNSSEGLLRTFIEPVSNAIDNCWRSREFGIVSKKISINIDKKTGRTSVWNDGKSIPFYSKKYKDEYFPDIAFFNLLSSTNYDDDEKKKTSGRNGYGAKLTNIFADDFAVVCYNCNEDSLYIQRSKRNMFDIVIKPTIINCKESSVKSSINKLNLDFFNFDDYQKYKKEIGKNNGFTLVSWIPDFKRFESTKYDDDTLSVFEKYIFDTAMVVSKHNVQVYYNGNLVPISSLKDYAQLYTLNKSSLHTFSSSDSRVVLMESDLNKHTGVSFVNGIHTPEGGVHYDEWSEAIFRPIVDKINKVKKDDKKKKEKKKVEKKVDIGDVKKYFFIFIDCEVDNPRYRGQNKTYFASPQVEVKLKKTDITKIMKWSVIDKIRQMIEIKELVELNKKSNIIKLDGFCDAYYARKKSDKRKDCVLTITEGLSARTYVKGGSKYGLPCRSGKMVTHEYIGILPIKGKCLNPRGKSMKTISKNKEVKAIFNALGVKTNFDYTEENLDTRYGCIRVFADADKDGIHIIGLVYNLLHALCPSILKIPGFFGFNRAPIMVINYENERLAFRYLELARAFIIENEVKKRNLKYFKGLGASKPKDIREDFGKRIAELVPTEDTDLMIDNTFNKDKSNVRKDWIIKFDPKQVVMEEQEDGIERITVPNFINKEFILFSIEDCKRSIPRLEDGFKESQGKILYAVFKRNLRYSGESLKVAQLSGYTAEHTLYPHGEDNLIDTIRGMGQRYVGSNNMPFLFNDGQFGSRLSNGKDGASGRYIFTKMESYIRYVFSPEDDDYLTNLEEDGVMIEKKFYMPVIPMVLANGCIGIGTGFSTNIPGYNPLTLIECVIYWIKNEGKVIQNLGDGIVVSDGPELTPWFRKFKGEIKVKNNVVYTYGVLEKVKEHKYRVTELPIGRKFLSIDKFLKKLEELYEKKSIKDFKDNTDDNTVDFLITEDPDGMKITLESLELVDTIHTSNMVLFSNDFETGENHIKRYNTVEEILNEFCVKRYKYYQIRREGNIKKLEEELKYTNNKIRFINEVNLSEKDKNRLVLKDREDEDLDREMEKRGFDRKVDKRKKKENDDIDDSSEDEKKDLEENDSVEEDGRGSFNYLLDLKMRGAMKKKMEQLLKVKERLEKDIKLLKKTTVEKMWLNELEIVKKKYEEWLPYADEERDDYKSSGGKKGKKKK